MIVIYLDGMGTYQVRRSQVISVILRLGDEVIRDRHGGAVGMMSLSGSGKGVKNRDQGEVVCGSGPESEASIRGEGEEGNSV